MYDLEAVAAALASGAATVAALSLAQKLKAKKTRKIPGN